MDNTASLLNPKEKGKKKKKFHKQYPVSTILPKRRNFLTQKPRKGKGGKKAISVYKKQNPEKVPRQDPDDQVLEKKYDRKTHQKKKENKYFERTKQNGRNTRESL